MNTYEYTNQRNDSKKLINNNFKKNDILNEIKLLLKNQIFSGCYTERRLIEIQPSSMYKDVIDVDKSEYEFKKILKKTNEILHKYYCREIITSIAEIKNKNNSSDYSIWTKLSHINLGYHWFIITNVTLDEKMINISVRSLRSYNPEKKTFSVSSTELFNWENFMIISSTVLRKLIKNCSRILTIENMTNAGRFMLILFLTLLIGCYRLLQLSVKYIHELNYFIRTLTPIFIACIDNITKAFGGLLIVITMIWNGSSKKKNMPVRIPISNIEYHKQNFKSK